MDGASVDIRHVKLDDNDQYEGPISSGLNDCLTMDANIDQTGRAFLFDVIYSMLDEGSVAIVPVDYEVDDNTFTRTKRIDAYSIRTLRVGRIVEWGPTTVKVNVFNQSKGIAEDVRLNKDDVAIVENPFFSVMNSANSTTARLSRKLMLLDAVDEKTNSGKLDLIIKLPYVVRGEAKKKLAEERRISIEEQLSKSQHGIAYTDATEGIVQLNRPIENNLKGSIEYYQADLFSKLGMTQSILDGTADEKTMNNYYNRTVVPIVQAIVDELVRKYIPRVEENGRMVVSKKETIMFFNNIFQMIPLTSLAEVVDKLRRNEVMSPNEFRKVLGMKPSNDPDSDKLQNSNIKDTGTPSKIPISKDSSDKNNLEGGI